MKAGNNANLINKTASQAKLDDDLMDLDEDMDFDAEQFFGIDEEKMEADK